MKKIKFLTALILAITLNFGFVVADATAKNNVENKGKVEEVKAKEEKTKDKNEKEQEAKAEEIKRKEIEKNIKEHEKLEEEEIKKNKKKYENFKKEDYEIEGFNLEVFWKNGVPYLHYVHKKTKAQIVFILVEEEDLKQNDELVDSVFFKTFCNSDSGLTHFAEHCLSSFDEYFREKYGAHYEFNAFTYLNGFNFVCSSSFPGRDLFFKKCYETLTDEKILDNEDVFKIEKKRIIDETKMKKNNVFLQKLSRYFEKGGTVENLKKVKFKDVRNFFRKYIHPSNMIITKHVTANRKNIINFLKDLENLYLDKFNFKNVTSKFKLKVTDKFRKFKVPEKCELLEVEDGKNKKYAKYGCVCIYDLDKLNVNSEQAEGLDIFFNDEKLVKKIEKFIKKLGYSDCGYDFDIKYCFTGKLYLHITLNGNDENLFKKDVLNKNLKKFLEFLKKESNSIEQEEIQKYKPSLIYQKFSVKDQENCAIKFAKPYLYTGCPVDCLLDMSFTSHNEPFSPKVFYMGKNNEIIDSKENILEKTKNNLNAFDILIKNNPSYIDMFEGDENEKEYDEKKEYKRHILPIKIKEYKNNKMVYMFANDFIRNRLGHFLSFKKGYCYDDLIRNGSFFVGDFLGSLKINNESKKNIFRYLEKDFGKFIENLKFTRKDFDVIISKKQEYYSDKAFTEALRKEKKYLNNIQNWLKAIDDFCKTGKTNDKLFNKYSLIKDFVNIPMLFHLLSEIDNNFLYKDYNDYNKIQTECFEGQLRFVDDFIKQKEQKITKKFLKDYKEYFLEFCYNLCKHRIKCLKENKKLLENVKYEDVLNAIKSAAYCDGEEYKKRVNLSNKLSKLKDKVIEVIEKFKNI